MDNSLPRRVAHTLHRNAAYLAGVATQLLSSASPELWEAGRHGDAGAAVPDWVRGTGDMPRNKDEAITMGAEGFRRLGNLIAMSVMVEEPALLVDDLSWLECMGKQPGSTAYNSANTCRIIGIYLDACNQLLDRDEYNCVAVVVEKALQIIRQESPPQHDR